MQEHWIALISVHSILTSPHSQLKTRMEELIRNAYNTRDASHMALGKDYAYWTSRPVANTRNLTVNQLVERPCL